MATDTHTDEAAFAATDRTTPDLDFDTRLELAAAGMDAIHAHNHGVALADAHRAVTEALSTVPEAEELLTPKFTPNADLAAAGELIRKRGWIQGAFEAPNGALCAWGAVRVVIHGRVDSNDWDDRELVAEAELRDRIAAAGEGDVNAPVSKWNDSRKSVEDVLKLLY